MDAELLVSKVRELQEKHGQHINVLVNHEEILIIAYRGAIPEDETQEYITISSDSM